MSQLTDPNLSNAIWQTLHRVNLLLGQSLPWARRLEEVSNILLETLECDAAWLITQNPLPGMAYGLVITPLAMAPDAQVQVIDKAPPFAESWPRANSLLGQVIASKKPRFIEPKEFIEELNQNGKTGLDLGDVFFNTFGVIPSAAIPLLNQDQAVGALVVASHDLAELPLSESKQTVLNYLGEYLGASLQNAYLIERSRRHADALRTLNHIAQTITSSLDIEEVIRRTMIGINKIMDVEAGSILLVDEVTRELYFKITLRGENKQITSFRLAHGEGIAGWVVANNRPVIANHADRDTRFSSRIDQAIGFTTRTVLCVPLLVQGQPIGVLEMINKYSGPFDEDDLELLISMAASLGVALKNASLYEDVQDRAQRSELINQVATAINTGHGLSETAKTLYAQCQQLLPFHHISLSLLDDSKEKVRQWVLNEHGCFEQKELIPFSGATLATVVARNEASIEADISIREAGAQHPDDELLLQDGVRSRIILPLATRRSPYGALYIGHRLPEAYSLSELAMLEQLLPQLAVAIEKAHLIDTLEQRTTELQMLNRLGEMLVSTTDLKLIIETALSMIPRLLPGDVQGVIIAGEQGIHLGAAVPFGFSQTDRIIQTLLDTFREMSEDKGPARLISSRVIPGNMPVPENWGPVTTLALPILNRLGVLGVIYMASGRDENLSNELLRVFSLIVSQISASVENARLFHQIEQERARLAAILTSSTDAVLVVDSKGRIVLDNPAARKVMDATASQRGRLLADSTRNKTLVQLFEGAMRGGKQTGEVPLLNDDRTFYANLSPVAVGEGEVIGWVATMQDVSHFKELDQLKSDFVNSVSHDLRSPLAGILIATKLFPDFGPINERQQEFLDTIERRVRTMSELIDDLLDVGRIDAGIDMEMEPHPLAPIITEAARFFEPQAAALSIQLACELPPDLPLVLANPLRLRQVFHNLLSNAIKYTPAFGRALIKTFSQDDEVYIEVTDTGVGIPAADQPRVFEKFYRVRSEDVAQIKGSGLGLAITKSIIEKHHGRIWVKSTLGQGSTFTVALPVFKGAPEENNASLSLSGTP